MVRLINFNVFDDQRKIKEKNETYRKNIDKRGNVPNSITVSFNIIFYPY